MENSKPSRRTLMQMLSLAGSAPVPALAEARAGTPAPTAGVVEFPRRFTGPQLRMIAFPLGGVGAGSVSLGGRGQLRDWEMFNRPDKGNTPSHAYPCFWVKVGENPAVAGILESRIQPPYEGALGLGASNLPGMTRLENATFTGEYPLASIDFSDRRLPLDIRLEAFSPFIPQDADESGLPVAILRYRVRNRAAEKAVVSVAWVLENPMGGHPRAAHAQDSEQAAENEIRTGKSLRGVLLKSRSAKHDPLYGSMCLATLNDGGAFSALRGWKAERWWASPMLFWDDFSADGQLGPEAPVRNSVASACLQREIDPGQAAAFTYILAWHFPNRTPEQCGWKAPKGYEATVIGNWYCTKFEDAWAAASYAAENMAKLEEHTREFVQAMRDATLPPAVKDAATANLSTLATTTCFRTADGEFHGFEGVSDKRGCCFGNCTHVWNYEVATDHLFPSLARSFRKSAFGYSLDDAGAMHVRQLLPDGKERSGFTAADGQMGQIVKAYLDWRLWGSAEWLRELWPRVRKAIEFCWAPGGWDGDRDGVMEGAQHNTYDVEFFGPNPQCGIYYLAGLRAAEEMALAVGDAAFSATCRALFEKGSRWIDDNLFNSEYYVQKVRGIPREKIPPVLLSAMGTDDTASPSFQVGDGCLVDQLVGQYLAGLAGLGNLVRPDNMRTAVRSLWRYNLRRDLFEHETFQRIYALNDEAALIICHYGKGSRPRIPFPYYAEAWTGLEYPAATLMIDTGMLDEGVECFESVRRRYDGLRRNPWDEAECGHHYARAMSAWSGVLALSGFTYRAPDAAVHIAPKWPVSPFRSIWTAGTGWGLFRYTRPAPQGNCSIRVNSGELKLERLLVQAPGGTQCEVRLNGSAIRARAASSQGTLSAQLDQGVVLRKADELEVTFR